MKKTLISKKELRDIFNSPDFSISLQGGNDSGGLEVSGIEDDNLRWKLDNIICNASNYGSFAGNYEVSMEGSYSDEAETLTFEGSETDYENYGKTHNKEVSFKIPENIIGTIDSITYFIQASNGEIENASVNIIIKNGIWTDDHENFEKEIIEKLENLEIEGNCYIDENKIVQKEDTEISINVESGEYQEEVVSFSLTLDKILINLSN